MFRVLAFRRARCGRAQSSAGSIPALVGKRDQETLVGEHMLQHAGEKAGLARGGADFRQR